MSSAALADKDGCTLLRRTCALSRGKNFGIDRPAKLHSADRHGDYWFGAALFLRE